MHFDPRFTSFQSGNEVEFIDRDPHNLVHMPGQRSDSHKTSS